MDNTGRKDTNSVPAQATPGSQIVPDDSQVVGNYASNPSQTYSVESLEQPLEVYDPAAQTSVNNRPSDEESKKFARTFSKRKAMVVSGLITLVVILITGTSMLLLVRQGADKQQDSAKLPQQDVSIQNAIESQVPEELKGAEQSLLVQGDVITRGNLKVSNGQYVTVLRVDNPSSNQTLTLPSTSGTICLDNNNCGYASLAGLTGLQGEVGGLQGRVTSLEDLVSTFGQIVVPPAGVTQLNGQKDSVTIQGSLNRVSVSTSNGVITLSTPQALDANANVQFGNLQLNSAGQIRANNLIQTSAGNSININAGNDMITFTAGGRVFQLPAAGGALQTICTTGATCASGSGTAVILSPDSVQVDGSTDASIYINDTGGGHLLHLQSGGVDRLVVDNTGATTVSALTVTGLGNGFVRSTGGALSVVASVDLASEVSGTLAVANGGTGTTSLLANGVLVGNGSSAISSITAGVAGQCLVSTAGAPSFQVCPGTGGVSSVNGDSGAIDIVGTANQINVLSSGGTITLSTPQDLHVAASPTFAGLTVSSLGSGPLRVTAGVLGVGNLDLTSEVSGLLGLANGGTGANNAADARTNLGAAASGVNNDITSLTGLSTITPAGALTVGATGQSLTLQGNASTSISAGNGANITTVGFVAPTGVNSILFPALTGTVCLDSGNCAAAGAAGGDLSGNYPNPTIAKLQGVDLSVGSPTAGQVIIYNGLSNRWENYTITGDISVSGASIVINNNAVTTGKIADGNVTNAKLQNSSLTVTAGGGLIDGGSISLGGSATLNIGQGDGIIVNADDIAVDGTVCRTSGNCAGVGGTGDITGGGNANRLAVFNAAKNIVDSYLLQSAGTLTLDNGIDFILDGGDINVTGNGIFTGTVSGANATQLNEFVTLSQLNGAIGGVGGGVSSLNTLAGDLDLQGTAGQVIVSNTDADTITLSLGTNVTLQGNAFNGAGQLVQLGGSGELPVLDGANLTNVNAALLQGQNGAYYLDLTNATGTLNIARIANGSLTNAKLQNSALDVVAGAGLINGGSVSLGSSTTLNIGAGDGITVNADDIAVDNTVCRSDGTNCSYGGGSGAGVASVNSLVGDIVIQGDSVIGVNASNPNINLSIQANSIGDAYLAYDTGQHLTVSSTPQFAGLYITGNVGIGTNDPQYKLDVAGTANAITLFQNGNQVCDNSGNCAGNGNGGGATNAGQENFLTKTDANGNLVSSQIYDDGTKISIGSTNPGYDLEVNGTISATTIFQDGNQVCDVSGNCGYNGDGVGAGVASVNTLTGDLTIQGNSQVLVTNVNSSTIGLSIQNDTIGDAQLQYNTGQHLTVTSTPTFAGLILSGDTTANRPISPTEGQLFYDTDTHQLLVYNGGKWQADATDAVLVAASDSSQADKDAAHFLADGDTGAAADGDQVEINLALTVGAGKKVVLLAGTYVIDAPISIPNNTTLTGIGQGSVITIPNAFNTNISMVVNTDTSTGTNVAIQNLRIDGNRANQSAGNMNGIDFTGVGSGSGASALIGATIKDVQSMNFRGSIAISITSSNHSTISNVLAQNAANVGISIAGGAFNKIESSYALGNGFFGISINGTDTTVINSKIEGNETGFAAAGSRHTITNNIIKGNNAGLTAYTTSHTVISSNVVTSNTFNGISVGPSSNQNTINGNIITSNALSGIRISSSSNNTISDNIISDNGAAGASDAIAVVSTSQNNRIIANNISDTAGTGQAIDIDATSTSNYLADNTYGGTGAATLNIHASSNTVFGGQVNSTSDYVIQPAGSISLMTNTTVSGTLTATSTVQGTQLISTVATGTAPLQVSSTTVVTNLNADLLDGQQGSFYQNASNINAGTLGVAQGGTGASSLTQYGILFGNSTGAVGATAAGTTGQCLLANSGGAPTWGACTPSTLQGTYNASSPATINLADNKDFTINATEAGTDPSIVFNLLCASCSANGGRFAIQDSGVDVFTVLPNGDIRIGTATNNMTLASSNGYKPVLSGTARNSKTIRLLAEYPSAVLNADGSDNLGSMTSGYDSTSRMNYYNWTTTQPTSQDYDVVVQVPIPSDFDGWDGANPLTVSTYRPASNPGTVTFEARDTTGAVICNYVTVSTGGTGSWTHNNTACTLGSGTYTPGGYMTLSIKLQAPQNGSIRVGNIVLNYLSKF